MAIVLLLFWVLVLAGLVMVSALRLDHGRLSRFEVERRADGGGAAVEALRRYRLMSSVMTLRQLVVALALVAFVSLSIGRFGWLYGIGLAVVGIIVAGYMGRRRPIQSAVKRLYMQIEPRVLRFVQKAQPLLRQLGTDTAPPEPRPASRQELAHQLQSAGTIIADDERRLLLAGLDFYDRTVADVMTGRDAIDSISYDELLGPLVLDDLHRTGHSYFPVISGDLDHIVGLLDTTRHQALDAKRSVTVRTAMAPGVDTITPDTSLSAALAQLLANHQPLLIVSRDGRTVGLVSLADIVRALVPRI